MRKKSLLLWRQKSKINQCKLGQSFFRMPLLG